MEPIVETPIETPSVLDAGVPHDTIVASPSGESERIVYESDEHGNVTGWHKEPATEGTV